MKLSSFLYVKGFFTFFFGIAILLMPTVTMSIYGIALDDVGIFMTRLFAVGMIGVGLICLNVQNVSPKALQGILFSLFVTDIIGFIVSLQIHLSGLMNPLGWSVVFIWLIFALGLGYFRFINKPPSY